MRDLPERDPAKSNAQQGAYRKFEVRRVDQTDGPGGKHDGCDYFVLDMTHDAAAPAALMAYAAAISQTHPEPAADLRTRYSLPETSLKRVRLLTARDRSEIEIGIKAAKMTHQPTLEAALTAALELCDIVAGSQAIR